MIVLSWVVVGYKRNVDIEALMNSIIYRGIYNSTSPFILSTFTSWPQTETERKKETVELTRATDTLSVDLSKGEGVVG